MRSEKRLTARVTEIHEFTECCRCYTFVLDGKEVLQAYQGFFYASDPSYGTIGEYGDIHTISKEQFNEKLNAILELA